MNYRRKFLRGMPLLFAGSLLIGVCDVGVLASNAAHHSLFYVFVSAASIGVMFFSFWLLGCIWTLRGHIDDLTEHTNAMRRLAALYERETMLSKMLLRQRAEDLVSRQRPDLPSTKEAIMHFANAKGRCYLTEPWNHSILSGVSGRR